MPSSRSRARRLASLSIGVPRVGVAIIAMLWVLLIGSIKAEEQRVLRDAAARLVGLPQAYEGQTQRLLQRADVATRFIAQEVRHHGLAVEPEELRQCVAGEPSLIGAYLANAQGNVTQSTLPGRLVGIADREQFRVHAEGRGQGLFISAQEGTA
jgi:hypothetical protein